MAEYDCGCLPPNCGICSECAKASPWRFDDSIPKPTPMNEMTPQPHDFKNVMKEIRACLADDEDGGGYLFDVMKGNMGETVLFALRLAERVCGEPSEGMVEAGENAYYTADTETSSFADGFKAMISEAFKEIENG